MPLVSSRNKRLQMDDIVWKIESNKNELKKKEEKEKEKK